MRHTSMRNLGSPAKRQPLEPPQALNLSKRDLHRQLFTNMTWNLLLLLNCKINLPTHHLPTDSVSYVGTQETSAVGQEWGDESSCCLDESSCLPSPIHTRKYWKILPPPTTLVLNAAHLMRARRQEMNVPKDPCPDKRILEEKNNCFFKWLPFFQRRNGPQLPLCRESVEIGCCSAFWALRDCWLQQLLASNLDLRWW